MKEVEAIDVVTIGVGTVLKLNHEQALPRASFLKDRGDGTFETLGTVQFKRGEKFGLEGVISKAMLESVNVDGIPGRPAPPEKTKNPGPVKFLMPKATDTPAAIQERLDKLKKQSKAK